VSRLFDSSGLRLPAHEATTAQLGVAYPFAPSARLRAGRVLVGRDLAGGPFCHDPFDLYKAGEITNPNMTILGQIGRGKSALVKSYLFRQAAFGRQVAVLDPKGEYAPLARALGVEPIRLYPRGGTRVNPLQGPSHGCEPGSLRQDRLVLLGALAEATLRRRLGPGERLCLEVALEEAGRAGRPPSLGSVVEALLAPGVQASSDAWVSAEALREEGREVGLELRRLVRGDLAGMFDAEASPQLGESAALFVDLSEVYHSEALPALMVCAASWLQSMVRAGEQPGSKALVVVDEAWAVLSERAVGRYLRASFKLARARGTANVAVCHRASDLEAAGAAGSEEARLAEGLMADSETVVCYAQSASELGKLAGLLGCSEEEISYLPRLGRGVALWRVGQRRFLVEHLLAPSERAIVDTDGRLV
jgi:type IV secretory pathway VirB4 component